MPEETSTTPRYPLYTPEARQFTTLTSNGNPFTPSEIGRAYSLINSAEGGEGVTVAVIGAYNNPTLENDFEAFGRTYMLPQNALEVYYTGTQNNAYNSGWARESAADTQWVYATAPSARIMCVFARDAQVESLFEAVNYAIQLGADIISMSWGSPEFYGQTQYTQYMKNSGRIFIASAGDTGGAVLFPSSSDAVVSVGGTLLYRNPNGNTFARSAWISGGGGPSRYTGIPEWQRKFEGIAEMSGGYRATPDIALDASPSPGYAVYNSADGGFISVGGTSVSAPVFAGITATLIQNNPDVLANRTLPEYLYFLAGETRYNEPQYYFNDITVGSNGVYDALKGYDMSTGLGAPIARQIVQGML